MEWAGFQDEIADISTTLKELAGEGESRALGDRLVLLVEKADSLWNKLNSRAMTSYTSVAQILEEAEVGTTARKVLNKMMPYWQRQGARAGDTL